MCKNKFDEDYWQWAGPSYWSIADSSRRKALKIRFAPIFSIIRQSRVILDIGCGAGHSTNYLRSVNDHADVIGIDLSEYATRRAKKIYQRIDFLLGDCRKLPIRDCAIDLIVAFEVYEHLDNPHMFLLEAHRVLKPGGYIFLSTPNPKSFEAIVWRRWSRIFKDPTHVSLTTPRKLEIDLKKSGFEVIRIATTGLRGLYTLCNILGKEVEIPFRIGKTILAFAKKVPTATEGART